MIEKLINEQTRVTPRLFFFVDLFRFDMIWIAVRECDTNDKTDSVF